ncbi:myosin-9-like [Archocentrus centrarchus]|uniref:myosin-9-like n=1 Tax=Archocentrus centrarchus TaxID=63155 RepID=UPI0011EA1DF2|nr:myosin-9-like [Archocentrus centrarchus]
MNRQNSGPGLVTGPPYTTTTELIALCWGFKSLQLEHTKLKEDFNQLQQLLEDETKGKMEGLMELKEVKKELEVERKKKQCAENINSKLLEVQEALEEALEYVEKERKIDYENAKTKEELVSKELSEVSILEEERRRREQAEEEIQTIKNKLLEMQQMLKPEKEAKLTAQKELENLNKDLLGFQEALEEKRQQLQVARTEIEDLKQALLATQQELMDAKLDIFIETTLEETEDTEKGHKAALKQLKQQHKDAKKTLKEKTKVAKRKLKAKVQEGEQKIINRLKELKQ